MIARLATHPQPGHPRWDLGAVAERSGFRAGYELMDALTGEGLSLTVWETRSHLVSATDPAAAASSPDGTTSVRLLEVVGEVGPPPTSPVERQTAEAVIGLLDTRVDLDQADLRTSLIEQRDFTGGDRSVDPLHGTTSAIALVGQGVESPRGLAPSARLLAAAVVGADGRAGFDAVAGALSWCVERGATTIAVPLGTAATDEALSRTLDTLDQGVTVFAAAGNGPSIAVLFPARHPRVVAVGAVDVLGRPCSPPADLVAPGWFPWTLGGRCTGGSSVACVRAAGAAAVAGLSILNTPNPNDEGGSHA